MKGTSTITLGKQRQLVGETQQASKELQMSFKNTSSLAHGLTKERVSIQTEFQKISAGKLWLIAKSVRQRTTGGVESSVDSQGSYLDSGRESECSKRS